MIINHQTAQEFAVEVAKTVEASFLAEINKFISEGLIQVQENSLGLVADSYTGKVEIKSQVRLTLRDQERLNWLENRNAELESTLKRLKDLM